MNWRLTLRGLLRPKLARRDEYYDRRIIQQSQQEPSTCGLICFGITAVVCAVGGTLIALALAPYCAAALGIDYPAALTWMR